MKELEELYLTSSSPASSLAPKPSHAMKKLTFLYADWSWGYALILLASVPKVATGFELCNFLATSGLQKFAMPPCEESCHFELNLSVEISRKQQNPI